MVDLKVQRLHRLNTQSPVKAFADISINDVIVIKGLSVIDGKNGLFVSMPRKQGKDKKWYDTIHCLSREVRNRVTEYVLEAYEQDN